MKLRTFDYPKLRLKSSQSERGFSLVEVLVAAAIISTAVVILSSGVNAMGKAKRKAAVINAAIALQAQLIDELSTEARFLNGAVPKDPLDMVDPVEIEITPTTGPNYRAVRDTDHFFNSNLQSCPGGFADISCTLRLRFNFRPNGTIWYAAYRITSNPNIDVPLGNLGTMHDNAFDITDYRSPLPDLLIKNSTSVSCMGPGEIGVSGINRNTGDVICLRGPGAAAPCDPDKFLKRFIAQDFGTHFQLVPDCVGAADARMWECPQNYRLAAIPDPRVFDSTYTGTPPLCRWEAQLSEPVGAGMSLTTTATQFLDTPPWPSRTISGIVCPRPPGGPNSYIANVDCTWASGAEVLGRCRTISSCSASDSPISVVPPGAIVGTTSGSGTDSINCSIVSKVTPPPGLPCLPIAESLSAIQNATISYAGSRTCTINPSITQELNATGSP
jgi:prepilin-type N-terminal cleavage/methylation domain-containing protein